MTFAVLQPFTCSTVFGRFLSEVDKQSDILLNCILLVLVSLSFLFLNQIVKLLKTDIKVGCQQRLVERDGRLAEWREHKRTAEKNDAGILYMTEILQNSVRIDSLY